MSLWNDFIGQLPQLLAYGLVTASVLGLGAVGWSFLYRIFNFANFAHGDLMTLGAYWGLLFNVGWHLHWSLAFPLAIVATIGSALLIDRVFYRPLRRRGSAVLLISSAGMALVLRNTLRLFWGQSVHSYDLGFHQAILVLPGVRLTPEALIGMAFALVVTLGLFGLLRYTRMGKALRAASDDLDLARVCGMSLTWITRWTWVLGAGLAAVGGIVLGVEQHLLYPLMGWNLLLPIFAAAVLGGLDHPSGALLGALVIGVGEELFGFFFPNYRPALALVMLIGLLLWRPAGLLGDRS